MTAAQAGDIPPSEILNVSMDEAKLIRLPDRVATIVVGNPLIADASLQPGGLVVLTGKGYGATNFIALDRQGNALLEKIIEVRGAIDTVVVYKGVNRETYSCAPNCQPVIAPGDTQQFFNQALVQTTARSTQASAMSAPR
ncbi:pilus assembly protein N-terminal domain-containing protein [Pseudorhodoplanes sp.]|uniref:pilus assembly protein N-terminal domain-containing protein n=1 Tax=Pseudorhodoplanes sp. TaxID=1934341 RepID=UPI002C062F95|nr:pilus assembly protein N-terminal domain-containing protein [Pseudorhodoplanes sp.]HWV52148.1 pilus assembly protein N-terminal domain-containing protein [Pseudorhodoplanes sp.]